MSRKRLTIIDPVKPPGRSYAAPIMAAAQPYFEPRIVICPAAGEIEPLYASADALWVDWAVESAARASRLNTRQRKKLWIRLHAFEVLECRFCADIAWRNVSGLIAVSTNVLALAEEHAPGLRQATRTYVIPNGVDCNRFRPSAACDLMHLAWVGEITPKKAPQTALHVLAALRAMGCDYRLSMAGAWTSDRALRHLRYTIAALNLQDYVRLDGHVDDMPSWFEDKGVLLSTSLYESFGFAIAEGAAAGLTPVVIGFPNAENLWPRDWIVHSIPQACEAVRAAVPGCGRDYVIKTYPLSLMLERIADIFSEP